MSGDRDPLLDAWGRLSAQIERMKVARAEREAVLNEHRAMIGLPPVGEASRDR